ncbi:PF20097 family protein [Anaerotignum sp.]
MKCPYCQKEMEKGFIQCRDGVTWTPKKQLVAAFSSLGRGSVSLENGAGNDRTVYAHHCEDCKKVIVDYSETK